MDMVSADALRTHLQFTAPWASRRLVDAAAQLTPEELAHDFKTADRNILETLVHTFAADRIWLWRLRGGTNPGFVSDADRSLEVLQNDWPALHGRWLEWAAPLTDTQASDVIAYQDMAGRHWDQPLWQLILHVVNHGTQHRGQVSGFLRALGHPPPATDLIHFYRTQ